MLTRPDGVYYTTSDLASAFNQLPFWEDTKKLTSFVVVAKQYMFEPGFYGLSGLPKFFTRIMTLHFAEMIAKKQAITYTDAVIFEAKTKKDMWKNLDFFFQCLRSSGVKAAPNNYKPFLWTNHFLGHIVSTKQYIQLPKRCKTWIIWRAPKTKEM